MVAPKKLASNLLFLMLEVYLGQCARQVQVFIRTWLDRLIQALLLSCRRTTLVQLVQLLGMLAMTVLTTAHHPVFKLINGREIVQLFIFSVFTLSQGLDLLCLVC